MISTNDVWAIEESFFRTAIETLRSAGADALDSEPKNGFEHAESGGDKTLMQLSIQGVIDGSSGPLARLMGTACDPSAVREKVKAARKSDQIDGVFLSINSPGGKVTGVEMLSDEIAALAEEKPVVAHSTGMMASAAYWIASQADERYAIPSAKIGSIAVVKQLKSFADKLDDEGIEVEIVRSGKYKQRPNPMEQLTSESVSIVERRVESIHDRFVGAISSGLGITSEEAEDLADGRVYLPDDAKEAGLIDGVKTPEAALSDFNDQFHSDGTVIAMRDPKYSQGDKVKWSWQGSTVHGRVAKSGDSFTVQGNEITGEEDEPVYKLDEYKDGSFKDANVAKPESSLTKSDKDMSTDSDSESASIESRVDRIEESVSALVDHLTEGSEETGEEEAEAESDAARAAAEDLVAQYEDRITPANRENYIQLAMSNPSGATDIMEELEANEAESDALPDEDATGRTTFGDMEDFGDDIGRTEDGKMIATNEEDAKVFDQLGLDYVDHSE